jgi:nickel-dependent lactate racemase
MILVATGLHRPNEGAELVELIGDRWVLENVRIANHFARRDVDHVTLGTTATRGTAVRIDRRFVESDLRIVTGLVEPHFMAGYSGGRKLIAPGLAHAETITTFHSGRFMADPAAANCNLSGNPLHEEQLEIVRMLGDVYALNTVIDEDRRLAMVNFGRIVESHRQAIDFVRQYCEVPVSRRFQTVVTSAAGYPLDATYYQTVKGMVSALDILDTRGDLIIASECSEGMGSREFVESQERLVRMGPQAFLREIMRKRHANVDEWQSQKQLEATLKGRVHLYSDKLEPEHHLATGVEVIESVGQAIRQSVGRSGDPAVAFIPEGPYVVPFFCGPASTDTAV